MQPGVVVANPSAFTWMPQLAGGLARAGMLRAYCSPLATTGGELRTLGRVLPGGVIDTMALRSVPADVPRQRNQRVGTATELPLVFGLRFGLKERRWRQMANVHVRRYDARVASKLLPSDEAVVAYSGASIRTLRRARELGVTTLLDYPIAHYETSQAIMQEELELTPDYAATEQGASTDAERLAQIDAEMDLADKVIAFCSFHRESFRAAGVSDDRLVTHPLGVDSTLFAPRPRPDDGVFRVLFSGQITQRKGISYLVEGFRRAAIPNSELLMIGRAVGTTAPWIDVPGVIHVPAVARTALPDVYSRGDVYVMPSLVEGFCLTGLESMSMGIPTIMSTNTFGPDVITDGEDGYVVPIRDADVIAERLQQLHADRELAARIGAAGRETARAYDWREYGDGMARLIDRVTHES